MLLWVERVCDCVCCRGKRAVRGEYSCVIVGNRLLATHTGAFCLFVCTCKFVFVYMAFVGEKGQGPSVQFV